MPLVYLELNQGIVANLYITRPRRLDRGASPDGGVDEVALSAVACYSPAAWYRFVCATNRNCAPET